ncbi:transient receptor potential channel pyrexia-like isoform X2 [Dysidea avara]|uniref:transient receptor potential channel pyrexia-like isoform X2 n=1 Tax=Dysidea avara TaxID=196820 RepID=UPI00332EA22A
MQRAKVHPQGASTDRLVSDVWAMERPAVASEGTEDTSFSTEQESTTPLLQYIAEICADEDKQLDFDVITQMLSGGVDINALDSGGQTCMHLVASNWQREVAEFLKEKGARLYEVDNFGQSPLHIASRVDNEEMVSFLVEDDPSIDQVTYDTRQTALHYAVLGNAANAIYVLVEAGANIEAKDHRGRTPLHLAAERDRTAAALALLSLDKPANCNTCDDSGHLALISFIQNMPEITHLALDQLQETMAAKRNCLYYLSALEPAKTRGERSSCLTPLQEIVYKQRYDLLTHPVIRKLLEVKWRMIGWISFAFHSVQNLVFLAVWTTFILVPVDKKHRYDLPSDLWRIFVLVVATVTFIQQVMEELWEYRYSLRQKKEVTYLQKKIAELDKRNSYALDEWNIIDIATYITLFFTMVTHFVDVAVHDNTTTVGRYHIRISCLAILLIWSRLFKLARVFPAISPFIAVIRGLIADVLRFVVVYLVIYIPFLICFWNLFGSIDDSVEGSEELTKIHRMAFTLFRMTLIDGYPYKAMRSEDELMALILVGSFLFITAVTGINLFIALLSNTFQRVYDNTLANAEMQRTQLMLQLKETYSCCLIGQRYLNYIHTHCNPLVCTLDDSSVLDEQDLRRATLQVRSIVKRLEQHMISQEGLLKEQHETVSRLQHEMSSLKNTITSHFNVKEDSKPLPVLPLKKRILKRLSGYPIVVNEVRQRRLSDISSRLSTDSVEPTSPLGLSHRDSRRWIRTTPEE